MFWKSQKEKELEDRIKKLLGPSTDIDSSPGKKAQSLFLIVQSLRSARMAKYTLWSVVILALAFIGDLIIRIIQLAK
ncbi:MAG: hypothetical protein ACFFCW_40885 [Candidatus Hodarchaeota archaeon]